MDKESVICAFQKVIGGQPHERHEAEQYLHSLRTVENFVSLLVHVSLSEYPLDLRKAASIYLKELVKTWQEPLKTNLPNNAKFLLFNLAKYVHPSVPKAIRRNFEEITQMFGKVLNLLDYIYPQINTALVANDERLVYAGVNLIYQLDDQYQFSRNSGMVSTLYYEELCHLFRKCTQAGQNLKLLGIVLKAIRLNIKATVKDPNFDLNSLGMLLSEIKRVLEIEGNPQKSVWKCKKRAIACILPLFNHLYAKIFDNSSTKRVQLYLAEEWAVPILAVILPQLLNAETHPLEEKLLNSYLEYINDTIHFQKPLTWLNQYWSQILTKIILPQLKYKESELQLWTSNPQEFVSIYLFSSDFTFLRRENTQILLVKLAQQGFLGDFMTVAYDLLPRSDPVSKEGLLDGLGVLHKQILSNPSVSQLIPNLLSTYVLPEFESDIGILRSKACWVYKKFVKLLKHHEEHQSAVLERVFRLFSDSELPVRVEIAISLPIFLEWKALKPMIHAQLHSVLEFYVQITEVVEDFEPLEAFGNFIYDFGEAVVPLAQTLCQKLIKFLLNTNENKGFTVSGVLKILENVLFTISGHQSEVLALSHQLKPLFDRAFTELNEDTLMDYLSVLSCLLYCSDEGTLPHYFPYFVSFHSRLSENDMIDDELFSVVGNYIQKYPNLVAPYLQALFNQVNALFRTPDGTELACKLSICLLEKFKNASLLKALLNKATQGFLQSTETSAKVMFSQVIFMCLWKEPSTCVNFLQTKVHFEQLCLFEFKFLDEGSKIIGIRRFYYGLGKLLTVCQLLPQNLHPMIGWLFETFVNFYWCLDSDRNGNTSKHQRNIAMKMREVTLDEENDSDDCDLDILTFFVEEEHYDDLIKDINPKTLLIEVLHCEKELTVFLNEEQTRKLTQLQAQFVVAN